MSKIKLTKGELKRQRDSLQQFTHYLPILQLKKQQLQIKILEVKRVLDDKIRNWVDHEATVKKWIGLLALKDIDIAKWVLAKDVVTQDVNIAGATIPLFQEVRFENTDYDLYATPFWVDKAIDELRVSVRLLLEIQIIRRQIEILQKELQTTTQRVNLFEKIKIPEALENIRLIRIFLGDQLASAVGVSKVAKRKIEAAVF